MSCSRNNRRNSRDSTRTGRKNPRRQASQRTPSGDSPPAGHDAVHMRMMRQRGAPGVQDQRHADLRAEMLRIGSDGAQRLRGDREQSLR